MKTTVFIPENVFADGDKLARRLKKSRSELYTLELRRYLARHAVDRVTETLDRVCAEMGNADFEFAVKSSRETLRRE